MSEHTFKSVEEQLAHIKKGVAEVIPEPELLAKLEASRKSGRPLRVYLGKTTSRFPCTNCSIRC